MSDEYQAQSLDVLFDSSQATQPVEQETELPQEETSSDEVQETTKEETPKQPDVAELEERLKKMEQRHKDTQKWANEAHQAKLKLMEKLHELGEATDEELAEVRKQTPGTQDEMASHVNEFFTRYNIVKEYIREREGFDPDELVEAFKTMYGNDQAVMQEFAMTPADKKVVYVLDKGREVSELHKAVKEHGGSMASALKAIKAKAAEEALASLTLKSTKKTETSDENSIKAKPRIYGSGGVTEQEYQPKSINQLLE